MPIRCGRAFGPLSGAVPALIVRLPPAALIAFFLACEAVALPSVAPGAPLAAARTVQNIAVFGTDDRVPLPQSQHGLEASIGLLYDRRSRSVCTAFCVGEATIATAAHCLYRTSGERPPKLSDFTFRLPGKGAKIATRIAGARTGSAAQHVMAGSTQLSIHPPIDASRDWGLVRLSEPVCKGAALAVSRRPAKDIAKLSAAQRVYHVAFHRDFGNWQLAYGAPCAIRRTFATADWTTISHDFSDAEQIILHTCDTGGASSGSPLLIDGPSGPEVVGINVGTYVQSKVLMQNGEVVHRYKSDTVANTGVSAAAFVDRLEAFAGADILAARETMRELQALLAAHGFYAGPRDGAYGALLRAAIVAFERSEGRPETGLATATLMHRLAVLRAERPTQTAGGQSLRLEAGALGLQQPTKGHGSVPSH